jgi:hypothetical protein
MSHDVISATYIGGHTIALTFDNGKRGTIDFTKFWKKGGVFAPLQNLEFFKSFSIDKEIGILKWGNDIDVAPETLYSEATGEPLPEWMNEDYKKAA